MIINRKILIEEKDKKIKMGINIYLVKMNTDIRKIINSVRWICFEKDHEIDI